MITVHVMPNALDPSRSETLEGPELLPLLVQRFGRWPDTARLWHLVGKLEHEVTPQTADDARALAELDGPFVVRLYPAGLDPVTGGAASIVLGAIKLIDWIVPDAPGVKLPEQRAREGLGGSPNNSLGKRTNKARPKERIPYILGEVKSTPDLLTVPYTTYVNHVEVETAYYCIGVGEHDVSSVRDGDMLITQIPGSSAEVYGPGKAPTGGAESHEPESTTGDPIEDDVYVVYQVDSVNGQELAGFSDFTFYGSAFPQNGTEFIRNRFYDNGDGTGIISVPYTSDATEITDRCEVGDELFVYWPMDYIPPGGVGTAPDLNTPITSTSSEPVDVTGLTVLSIDDTDPDIQLVHITVSIPTAQQAQWALLQTYFEDLQDPGDLFPYVGASYEYAQVTPLTHLYAGPFFIDFEHPPGTSDFEVVCNFVAPRGLFADDGVTTRPLYIEIQVILTPANAAGIAIGAPESFEGTLEGSATARGARALTLRCKPSGFAGVTRCLVRARRLTNSPRRWRQTDDVEENFYGATLDSDPPRLAYFSGTVVDEVRWTHCYSMSKPGNISFGNVTTIHTRTVATNGALRVKERNLNCLAFRRVQTWNGSSFGGTAVANSMIENLLFTVMKDSTIGNLPDSLIDFDGIVATMDSVRTSVPSAGNYATSLCYTFDDADISFEETLQAICQAAFCVPYRDSRVVKVRAELAGDDSVLVLGHRNIVRDTMKITHTFGEPTENDSVEVGYVDQTDRTQKTVIVPISGAGLRPRQLKVVGLHRAEQAYWHAYRALHKMRYQRQSVSLEATQEAEILGVRSRALIADLTRRSTQDGEVVGWDGSDTIRTSQPVQLDVGRTYTLFLQNASGVVEEFAVESAPSARELQLSGSPSPDLITDRGQGVPTIYILVPDDEPSPRAYLIASVRPSEPMQLSVEAVNYSHLYYFADGLTTWVDFTGGLVDQSPLRRALTNTGGSISGGRWTGGSGDHFDATDPTLDTLTESYTKILLINATAPADEALIESTDGVELFGISAGDPSPKLLAGHNLEASVEADFTQYSQDAMVAVTYDGSTDRMALFIDGVLVDEATVAAQSGLDSQMRYLKDFYGTCRWLGRWARCMSDREIREIYLRMRT